MDTVEGITPLVWKKTGANTYDTTSTCEAEERAQQPEHSRYVSPGSYHLSGDRKTLTLLYKQFLRDPSTVFPLERFH